MCGNVSELPSDLDCIFGNVRDEKVGGMTDVGGGELRWAPPRASDSLWTVLKPDPADSSNLTESLVQLA